MGYQSDMSLRKHEEHPISIRPEIRHFLWGKHL